MDEVDEEFISEEEVQALIAEYNLLTSESSGLHIKPRKILNAPLPSDRLLTPGARKR